MKHMCLLVSDFNIAPLAGYLRNDEDPPIVDVVEAPHGVVEPIFLCEHPIWQQVPVDAVALVWTRPQAIAPSFADLLRGIAPSPLALESDVDRFVDLLLGVGARLRALLVPLWTLPPAARIAGIGDFKVGGRQWALQRMNARLVQRSSESALLHVLDAPSVLATTQGRSYDAKLWHMGKVAFANPALRQLVGEVKAALRAVDGRAKKLVVVDLDDTLWGDSVGEVGWQHIKLGGHDYVGEAHVEFQHALKALAQRGVLLAIASRNEENVALQAIDCHPEMVLRRDDFAAWRIGWGDKAASVAELVEELNIGLQDVVFIDDHPAERARVRAALPEVLVPEWPSDPAFYAEALAALRAFDAVGVSREDGERTRLYADERRRRQARQTVTSLEDWLAGLQMEVRAEALNGASLERAAQLLNKTNQMNLRTRRLSAEQLAEWPQAGRGEIWTFRVADRFGDAGLCGLVGLAAEEGGAAISDFVLSCRVMGRGVEEALLHFATRRARAMGGQRLLVEGLPTPKNKPCLDFFARALGPVDDAVWTWSIDGEFALPPHVQLHA